MHNGAKNEVEGALDGGVAPSVIMYALDEAAAAERPSWAYARAVIAACIADGARTAEKCAARDAARRGVKPPEPHDNRPPALQYLQRQYKDGELDYLYMDLSTPPPKPD